MAERTVWVRIRNAPDGADLDLELRYLGNRDFRRAMTAAGFADLGEAAATEVLASAIAQHVVRGWKRPEPYAADVVEKLLVEIATTAPEVIHQLAARVSDPDAMGYPRLVDPVELGNG